MTRSIKLFVCIAIALAAVILLCGCGKKWTVSFDTGGGSEIPAQSVDNGARIIKPEDPTRDGYTFVRWTCFDESWSFVENAVTENLTLKAIWKANQYEIKIHDGTKVDTRRIEFGKEYKLGEPKKEGYTFAGYYLNGETFNPVGTYDWPNSIDITVKWEINTYTATFIAFGQQVGTATFTVEDKELKNIPAYTKYGYPVAWNYKLEPKNITIFSDTIYFGEYEQDGNVGSKEKKRTPGTGCPLRGRLP
ncbi:MAG: InlB B-repeat-containing protein, partial [Clostridia bacterium]|nr:InlB B-repeat-containing protein [Clostridia bacterium]